MNPERKFLHDLATPIAVMRIMLKKAMKEPSASPAKVDCLAKAVESLEQIETLHASRKAEITQQTGGENRS